MGRDFENEQIYPWSSKYTVAPENYSYFLRDSN